MSVTDDLDARRRRRRFRTPSSTDGLVQLSDLGNARRFARDHGQDFRHAIDGGWFAWDGQRFALDTTGERMRRAQRAVLELLSAAADDTVGEDQRRGLVRWALASQDARRLRALLSLAESEPPIVVPSVTVFDADPWLLNVANGTLDLRTGSLRPADRADLISKLAPVAYDPAADCPQWLAFLARIFKDDGTLIAFMQRVLGYALTGSTAERVLFILWGRGANGKTSLLEIFRRILGDYGQVAMADLFTAKQFDSGIPNDIAALRGARFVTATETERGKRLAEAKLKALTGNETNFEDTPLAREGRAVIREMKAQADHIREGTQAMLWDLLHEEMPEGQGPPRRLRYGPLEELTAWQDGHESVEVRKRIGAILKAVARQMLAEIKAEEDAERAARTATGDAPSPTARSGSAPSREGNDVDVAAERGHIGDVEKREAGGRSRPSRLAGLISPVTIARALSWRDSALGPVGVPKTS